MRGIEHVSVWDGEDLGHARWARTGLNAKLRGDACDAASNLGGHTSSLKRSVDGDITRSTKILTKSVLVEHRVLPRDHVHPLRA